MLPKSLLLVNSSISLTMSVRYFQYNCCGVENFEEFLWASKWNRFYQIEVDGSTENVTLQIPIACCKTTGAFPEVDLLTPNCTWDPNIDNSNMNNVRIDIISSQHRLEIQIDFNKLCAVKSLFSLTADHGNPASNPD